MTLMLLVGVLRVEYILFSLMLALVFLSILAVKKKIFCYWKQDDCLRKLWAAFLLIRVQLTSGGVIKKIQSFANAILSRYVNQRATSPARNASEDIWPKIWSELANIRQLGVLCGFLCQNGLRTPENF